MKKTLLILCDAADAGVNPVVEALHLANVSPLAPQATNIPEYGNIEHLLRGLLGATGLGATSPLPTGWTELLASDFEAAVYLFMEDFIAAEDRLRYVSAPSNAFFIEAWRRLCRNLGVACRFIYVRDFPWHAERFAGGVHAVRAFNTAAAVARQAGADIACFEQNDWTFPGGVADSAIFSYFCGGAMCPPLPSRVISANLKAGVSRKVGATIELQALDHIFAGKHFGAPLFVPADAEMMEIVEWASTRASAIYAFLQGEHPLAALDPPRNRHVDNIGAAGAVFDETIAVLRKQLASARRKLKEQEAAPVGRAKVTAATGQTRSVKIVGNAEIRGAKVSARGGEKESSRAGRLWAKFRRDPRAFFADSKNPVVRALGWLARRDKRKRRI